MKRRRCDVFDLFLHATNVWVGHRCTHDGRKYAEWPVVVHDLTTIPPKAHVLIDGKRVSK